MFCPLEEFVTIGVGVFCPLERWTNEETTRGENLAKNKSGADDLLPLMNLFSVFIQLSLVRVRKN
jgi:hypothetical protein